jgi:hypothetical protein
VKNVPLPASPDGDGKVPDKLPAGTKTAPFVSPNGGNPHRGSGIGAPLPSLAPTRWRPGGILGSLSPARWWTVAGSGTVVANRRRSLPCVDFLFHLPCVSTLAHEKGCWTSSPGDVGRRLQGAIVCCFVLSCAGRGARQRFLIVRF